MNMIYWTGMPHFRFLSAKARQAFLFLPCIALLSLACSATPASAYIVKIDGQTLSMTPRAGVNPASLPGAIKPASAVGFDTTGNMTWHGGPVMHSYKTYALYWDPGYHIADNTIGFINQYFTDVAHDSGQISNVFSVDSQYTDGSGAATYSSTFGGYGRLIDAYPTSGCTVNNPMGINPRSYLVSWETNCLTDAQVRAELSAIIAAYPSTFSTGPNVSYTVYLPHNVAECYDNAGTQCSDNIFCGYHEHINSGSSEVLYSVIPFTMLDETLGKGCQGDGGDYLQEPNTDIADLAIGITSHELSETITDPVSATGWHDSAGAEVGDKCGGMSSDPLSYAPILGGAGLGPNLIDGTWYNQVINGHNYYTQSEWSNSIGACQKRWVTPAASFTMSTAGPITPYTTVNFNATASNEPNGALAKYMWNFDYTSGDVNGGTTPSYMFADIGTFTVTLTVTDAYGGTAETTKTITVARAPSPPHVPTPTDRKSVV